MSFSCLSKFQVQAGIRILRNLCKHACIRFTFNFRNTANTIMHHAQEEYQENSKHKRSSHRANNDIHLLRLARSSVNLREVNYTDIAYFTSTHNTQLLNVIQHSRINFIIDRHIFLQTSDFLLRQRHLFSRFFQLGKFSPQTVLLANERLNARMFFLEQTHGSLFLLFQIQNLSLDFTFLVQVSVRFARHVHRPDAVTVIG